MKKLIYKLIFAGFILTMLTACEKNEFNPDFQLPRQFKPGDIEINAGETTAQLRWSPSLFTTGKNVTYTVQLSKDATFAGTPIQEKVVDTAYVVFADDVLAVKTEYFIRVKANALGSTAESGWVVSEGFSISGEQVFLPVAPSDIKDVSVLLKWRPTPDLTTIRLLPAGGTATEVTLTANDIAASQKLLTGLAPSTAYTAEIYRNTALKGTVLFTTKDPSIFTVTLQPGDNLFDAVANAANGDVIGLEPGTYDIKDATNAFANLNIVSKAVTIQSVSGNPANTIINFKAFVLKGTGAGLKLSGVTCDGTAGAAAYLIDFTGVAADAEQATFETITVDNVIARSTASCLVRGNRGGNAAYKIDSIILRNSIFSDNGTGGFDYILLDKMEFRALDISNSTFYHSGRRLVGWSTNFAAAQKPVVTINSITVNDIGYGGRDNLLLDANNNPIDFSLKNSIIANAPKPGQTVGNNLLRANGAGSSIVISNTNMFNLTNGATPTPAALVIPAYVVQSGNLSVDPGWTSATTDFTLPANSPLRTAGESGGPVGDPRWAQ